MELMFIWAVTFQSPLPIDALVVASNSLGIPCIWGSFCGFSKLALSSKPVKRRAGTQNVKHVRIPCAQQCVYYNSRTTGETSTCHSIMLVKCV